MDRSIIEFKRSQLERNAEFRESRRRDPKLRWLFFELTNACNLRCAHCGSSCVGAGTQLSLSDVTETMDDVLENLEEQPMIAITGGEPLLHPQLFEIGEAISARGFGWGMTTNATLIDDEAAKNLMRAGMSTVSVSLDGLEASHDALRHRGGAWRDALKGIRAMQNAGFKPQVTSVFHRGNLSEFDALFEMLEKMDIRSWRPINIEPIGRALEHEDMLLTEEEFAQLINRIREKRFDSNVKMEVTFGCSHYLGPETELMVRDHYFYCGAGISVASVRSNGDICACLDIENRPELIQGNIRADRFSDVWINRFTAFRRDRTEACEKCRNCEDRFLCGGDSTHTWDFDHNEPLMCAMEMLKMPLRS